jgi:hypothetical protein
MITTPPPVCVQLWAPGVDASLLLCGLRHAGLTVVEASFDQPCADSQPLLLAYLDPLGCCQQQDVEQAVAASAALLDLLPQLGTSSRPCRLVNLACVSIPAVVGWCVQPTLTPQRDFTYRFADPATLDALLALELLRREPQLADRYLALEQHPLAALLDQRPIDAHPEQRYQKVCSWEALLQARQQHNRLLSDLRDLAEQLEPLHADRLAALDLREQVQHLSARLAQAEQLKQRCIELELSLHTQQLDLEVMSRRLALLEAVLSAASAASKGLQIRLAQALAS